MTSPILRAHFPEQFFEKRQLRFSPCGAMRCLPDADGPETLRRGKLSSGSTQGQKLASSMSPLPLLILNRRGPLVARTRDGEHERRREEARNDDEQNCRVPQRRRVEHRIWFLVA